MKRLGSQTYLSSGNNPLGDGRDVNQALSDFRVAGDVRIKGDMNGARSRLASCGSRILGGSIDNLEVLLVDLGHQNLIRLERVHEIAIVSRVVGQRVLSGTKPCSIGRRVGTKLVTELFSPLNRWMACELTLWSLFM